MKVIFVSPGAQRVLDARGQFLDASGILRDRSRAPSLTLAELNAKLAQFWDRALPARTRETLSEAATLYTTDAEHFHALAAMNRRNRDFWRDR